MQYVAAFECALLFLVSLLLLSVSATPVFDKRSDLSAFTSAINGNGRLRYGKRAMPVDEMPMYSDDELVGRGDWTSGDMLKRSPVASRLVQSLNGAERLRFGRK